MTVTPHSSCAEFQSILELLQRRIDAGSSPTEVLGPVLVHTISTLNCEAGALIAVDPATRFVTLLSAIPSDPVFKDGTRVRVNAEARNRFLGIPQPLCFGTADKKMKREFGVLRQIVEDEVAGFEPALLSHLGTLRDRHFYLTLGPTRQELEETHYRSLETLRMLARLAILALGGRRKRGSSGALRVYGKSSSPNPAGASDAGLEELRSSYAPFSKVIGTSRELEKIFQDVLSVSPTRCSVLLLGESGTGKELLARTIHELSGRKDESFEAVDCGAFPENLIESELFGHVAGAFTGAHREHRGAFERADRGTIFLDELGEMSPGSQSRLLRVLQEGTFKKVGGEKEIRVDVRVVAATNRNLAERVEEGHFREDLFYRINHYPIRLPPLRERREDIPVLIEYFLRRFCTENGLPSKSLSDPALRRLMVYSFPGNIRELQNLVEVLALQSTKSTMVTDKHVISVFSRYRIDSEEEEETDEEMSEAKPKPGGETGAWVLDHLRASGFNLLKTERTLVAAKISNGRLNSALPVIGRHSLTYYLHGEFFRHFRDADWNLERATERIAGSPDLESRVGKRLSSVLASVATILEASPDPAGAKDRCQQKFSKMPSFYLPFLDSLVDSYYQGKWGRPPRSAQAEQA